jgi:hypothetical protein
VKRGTHHGVKSIGTYQHVTTNTPPVSELRFHAV